MEMDIDKVIADYAIEKQKIYKNYSSVVQELLCSILKTNNLITHSITNREKSPTSLKEKILRDSKNYKDPLSEITDLAGVRIITYFPEDVDKIIPLIEKEFNVDPVNSIDKRKKTDFSTFGYVSVHLIVELSSQRKMLPEYSSFSGLKCEIQVRTILQHAWAEIEHDIVYKSNDEIPFELRHRFASLAGLLEVADREFEQLRIEEVKVRTEIEKKILNEQYELPINRDSLILYLSKIQREKSILSKPHEGDKNNLASNRISLLLSVLNKLEIKTIYQLHKLLTKNVLEDAIKELDKVKKRCPKLEVCLIKYFIAIGLAKGVDKTIIAECSHCPAVNDLFGLKSSRQELSKDPKLTRHITSRQPQQCG